MTTGSYFSQVGGLPPQTQTLSIKAVFTTAYAVIPKTVMSDTVTSVMPHWDKTLAWIISLSLAPRPAPVMIATFSSRRPMSFSIGCVAGGALGSARRVDRHSTVGGKARAGDEL